MTQRQYYSKHQHTTDHETHTKDKECIIGVYGEGNYYTLKKSNLVKKTEE